MKVNGILTKTSAGYILYNHKGEVNISSELKHLWGLDIPVHITIESETRTIMDEDNCPIYYDRDNKRNYKFHINDRNIEDILENAIGKVLYITLEADREEFDDDTDDSKS